MVENSQETKTRVLVVEDEQEIRELMALHLLRQGFKVTECMSVEEAERELSQQTYNLVVLDWMLPGRSGYELLGHIKKTANTPNVLMVTAKTEPQDIVDGLEQGADDYLTKPFDPNVFMARVKALLRRNQSVAAEAPASKDRIVLGALAVNLKSYEVKMGEEPLHLTPSEFKLLTTMLESQGRVLTRDQLIEKIQGEGINVTGRTIDTHVFGLRKKLGSWSDNIETIRGVGYRVKMDAV